MKFEKNLLFFPFLIIITLAAAIEFIFKAKLVATQTFAAFNQQYRNQNYDLRHFF